MKDGTVLLFADLCHTQLGQQFARSFLQRFEFQPPCVEDLTATSRIKSRSIKHKSSTTILSLAHVFKGRNEVVEKRIVVVEAVGHKKAPGVEYKVPDSLLSTWNLAPGNLVGLDDSPDIPALRQFLDLGSG